MALTTKEIWSYAMLCFIFTVGSFLTVTSLYILKKDWNSVYLIKRKRSFVTFMIFAMSAVLFIAFPTEIFFLLQSIDKNVDIVIIIMVSPIQQTLLWLLMARFWLYYYDSQMLKFNKNKEWRMAIDPASNLNNWFVKNRHKYGNEHIMLKYVLLISFIQCLIGYILYIGINSVSSNPKSDNPKLSVEPHAIVYNIIFHLNYAAPIIPFIYLLYKMHKNISILHDIQYILSRSKNVENDNFGIASELILTSCSMFIFSLLGVAFDIVVVIYEDSLTVELIHIFFDASIAMIILYLVGIYAKQLYNGYAKKNNINNRGGVGVAVVNNNNNNNNKNDSISGQPPKKNTIVKKIRLRTRTSSAGANTNENITWRDVVATYEGFEAFMKHLEKEFSCENLLFVQEVNFIL